MSAGKGTEGNGQTFGLGWDIAHHDGELRLTMSGEIDVLCDGRLDDIRARVQDADLPVVLDLSAVGFMDSTGLRFLARLAQDLKRDGRPGLVLGAASEQVKRVLDISGLTDFFAGRPPAS
jgi:anti-anti-sigma factor